MKNKIVFSLILSLAFSTLVEAQMVPPPRRPPRPPGLPIDGGVAILLIAGVAYGMKKLK
ncbi:hypothetical protein GCM10011416_09990 [Polaribacter pacificus]|uniref:PEP-CTERM sorting domain-containing protein n=1 Tax=Polaribacter pacificus TaxID=1775173 RepID=A0A917HXT0_9FLAO|nr:hypothetical protein [Polaribacter pacificus]GGG94611.1 hypothetical protein GCM10011416_09990 [Polaribacter pacificus]